MDIYRFINSKDIEKHDAYNCIIKESSEIDFLLREWDYKKVSLRSFLQEYIYK